MPVATVIVGASARAFGRCALDGSPAARAVLVASVPRPRAAAAIVPVVAGVAQTFAALSGAVPAFPAAAGAGPAFPAAAGAVPAFPAAAGAGPGAPVRGDGAPVAAPLFLLATAVSASALFLAATRMAPIRTVSVFTVGASRASGSEAPGGVGAGIALLSGVTRIHPSSADAVPAGAEAAAVEPDRPPGEVPGPSSSDVRWAGGRVSAVRGPGRVPAACGVSRFVMVVPPR
ncbi:hypothetical protein ACICHK_25050 [Streptomyces sp. AHU1]|uniref:hypothetical protein n=1 Tax=Streptomyces sp. AHU1 TaxID=3377215 RepID=UPI003877CFD9